MTLAPLAVFCAGIGSAGAGTFGWYGGAPGTECPGDDPVTLAEAVARQLRDAGAVAVGFTCPLFVPLPADPSGLTAARDGEGARPWCAGAGAAALATGLMQVAWVLRRIRAAIHAPAYLKWGDFQHAGSGLFLWEALVSGAAKGEDDARRAVAAFHGALPDPTRSNAVSVPEAYSLIGAALLRTGWKTNPAVLATPALVIRVPGAGSD